MCLVLEPRGKGNFPDRTGHRGAGRVKCGFTTEWRGWERGSTAPNDPPGVPTSRVTPTSRSITLRGSHRFCKCHEFLPRHSAQHKNAPEIGTGQLQREGTRAMGSEPWASSLKPRHTDDSLSLGGPGSSLLQSHSATASGTPGAGPQPPLTLPGPTDPVPPHAQPLGFHPHCLSRNDSRRKRRHDKFLGKHSVCSRLNEVPPKIPARERQPQCGCIW